MRTILIIMAPLLFCLVLNAQHLEVDGRANISTMDEVNNADSVVVWLADGTLAWRELSTLNLSGWTMNNDTISTFKRVGVGTTSPIILGGDRVLEMVGDNEDSGSILQLSNLTRTSYLRLFGGRSGDPNPTLLWKEGGNLRFVTDKGGWSEKMLILSNGNIMVRGNNIKEVADPVESQDVATKAYVDNLEDEVTWLKSLLGVGEMMDSEGNVYPTVQIGTQFWMAKNLNVGTRINGTNNQADNGTIEKYCYEDLESNCDEYGGLYQWDEMMQYVNLEQAQGICPDGWHIPNVAEWTVLSNFLGGLAGGKMKEAGLAHWNYPNEAATNESGFTGLPGGLHDNGGPFTDLSTFGYLWSSSTDGSQDAFYRRLSVFNGIFHGFSFNKNIGLSVRCVRN